MNIKKLAAAVLCVGTVTGLMTLMTGCDIDLEDISSPDDRFVAVDYVTASGDVSPYFGMEEMQEGIIYVDTVTEVLYLYTDKGMTLLVNADGSPMIHGGKYDE